ncbi:hypothetical protein [Vibrio sp. H11]|uniref:hypothetical protein n=1 Tax=Vibrio sp. H11 TaxID=2565928 RepID=UPI0010A66128|nr:hypothetical protein [Vibrio sp. H11]
MSVAHEYNGLKGLKSIGAAYGISESTLSHRMNKRGMTLEEAIFAPLHERNRCKVAKNVQNVDDSPKTQFVAVRTPYAMPKLWRLALGFREAACR